MSRRPLLAYYYPAHHRTQSGWFEWDLVRAARPWFDGHLKPDVPLWGELDDSLPETFVRQAQAALGAGLDGFVVDFWWRPDGATLYEETLQNAVLPSIDTLPAQFRFALLWCPVWPRVRLPIGVDQPSHAQGIDRLFPFSEEDLARLVDHAAPYLAHPRALTVDGRVLFGFFHAWRLVAQLGPDGARRALQRLRDRAAEQGISGLYLVGCINQVAEAQLLADAGLDALTSYVFFPDWAGPHRQDYRALAEARLADWRRLRAELPLPYLPSVAVGWDATPRGTRAWDGQRTGFPWTPIIEDNTPDAVADAVQSALDLLDRDGAPDEQPVFIASWNEWSESHRLEPCERWGDSYLRAIARVRGLR